MKKKDSLNQIKTLTSEEIAEKINSGDYEKVSETEYVNKKDKSKIILRVTLATGIGLAIVGAGYLVTQTLSEKIGNTLSPTSVISEIADGVQTAYGVKMYDSSKLDG